MGSSTKNVKLGVCRAYLGGVDLGLTQGGVEVTVSTETHRVEVDQNGSTAINEIIMGRTVTATVPMAETTVRQMVNIMPGATLVSDGAVASGTVTFTSAPVVGDSVTIAGTAFTFQADAPGAIGEVKVGATAAESLQNLVDAINRAMLGKAYGGIVASVLPAGNGVKVAVVDPGTAGNAVTLAATGTGVTASGASLTGGVAETKARVEVGHGIGVDLLSIAQTLRLHPVGKADDDFSDDFVIYKAATPGALTFAYQLDAERIYNTEFNGYPDPETGKLFEVGTPLV